MIFWWVGTSYGEASFNDAYRQGVGQLEGVSAPTSQQISEREKQKIAAQQVPVQQTPVTSAQADREIGVPQYPVQSNHLPHQNQTIDLVTVTEMT